MKRPVKRSTLPDTRILCACTNLKMTARVVGRAYDDALAAAGLNVTQYAILVNVDRHQPISIMKLGKHVYCQKPLTHTVAEARLMRETARKMKVCTQMGNQGTAENGLRRAVEIIRAGVLGQVTEVHVWTNRPIWPQGPDAILRVGAARGMALAALHGKTSDLKLATPPKHVHWDEFLGTLAEIRGHFAT